MRSEEVTLLRRYGFFMGAFALILDERGRVLWCLREDLGIWNLPGGAVERGESPWSAVVREVKEETGLDARVDRLSGVYWRPCQMEVNFAFVCSITGGKASKTREAVETRYFAPEEVPERTARRHVARVRDALEHPGTTVIKTQLGSSWWELEERVE